MSARRASGWQALRRIDWIAAALLALFALQAEVAARRDSVTIDEFVHLPVGLYALYTGDLSRDPINPPFTRMIAALPLLARPPAFDPPKGTAHWSLGYLFMQRNAADYQSIFVSARRAIIGLALVLGFLVYRWSLDLYGRPAALAALGLYALTPDLLAQGHLVTLDLAGALGFTVTAYATYRMLARATLGGAALVGAAFGLATLLKLSGFVLVLSVAAAVAARLLDRSAVGPRVSWRGWLGRLALMTAAGTVVINLGYGFDGTFAALSTLTLDPKGSLAGLAAGVPWLGLPFPKPFVEGVDMVLNVGKEKEPSFFLFGELSSEGWWYYHLAAFAVKTPLPLLVFFAVALVAWALGKSRGYREYCVVLPILILFASNSLFNSLQIGARHVLPALPLLIVLASPWVADALAGFGRGGARRATAVATAALLAWMALGTGTVAPRYLQYFNETAGGPEGGHRALVDSNIDWGQDLIRLREYMDREGIEQVDLAYFGRVDPRVYGIRFAPLEKTSRSAHAVISATFLMGRPYFWFLGGQMRWVPAETYSWLRERKPIARVGSMFVYDLR
jgi:hypothetical protein